jgi:osmotically-inducible protein OsmY
VARALCATGYGSLRGIAVTVRDRVVILEGRVPSYYLKQVAQAAARAVPGGYQIRNDLEVERPG